MAVNMGSAVAFLELDTSKFTRGFKSAMNDLKVFGSKSATAEQKVKGLSSAMTSAGSTLTKGLTLPLAGVGAVALKAGTDFESAMSQVAATMGTTTDKIQNLSKFAQHMGATTAFSATQAAEGLNVLAQSGLTAEEQMQALPEVLNLAAAGNLSLADSSTYVVGTLKGFGKGMGEAKRVTDLVAKGATMANTDVRGLGTALSSSSATANSYGQNIDSVTLSLLRLAEQNITGEEAATSLNRAMMDLYTPTSTAKKALDALGVSAYDIQGNARDFNDVVDELNGKLSGMSEEERNAYKNTIFTTYGLQAFNKMTVSSTEKVNDFKEGLKDANDSALKQAKTQLDNLKGDITLFKSALEGAGIVISNVLIPNIRNFIQWLTNLVTKFNELSEGQQKFIVKAGIMVAAVGPVLLIFGKLLSSIVKIHSGLKNIRKAFVIFKNVFTGLGSMITAPMLAIVAIIAVLVAAFVTLWKTNENFRNKMKEIWSELKQVFSDFVNGVKQRFEDLGIDFDKITEGLKKAWETFCNILAPLFTTTFQTIVDFISGVLDVILGIIDVFIGIFTGNFDKVKQGIYEIFSGIVDFISDFVGNILDLVSGVLEALGFDGAAEKVQSFKETVQKGIEDVKNFIAQIPQAIVDAFNTINNFFNVTLPEAVAGFIKGIVDKIKEGIQKIKDTFSAINDFFNVTIPEAVAGAIQSVIDFLANGVNTIILFFTETIPNALSTFFSETIPNAIDAFFTFLSELPYKLGVLIGEMLGTIYNFAVDLKDWIITEVPLIIESVITFIKELPGKIWDLLVSVVTKVQEFGTNLNEKIQEVATSFVDKFIEFITSLPDKIWNLLVTVVTKVQEFGTNLNTKIKEIATNMVNKFIQFIKNLPSKVWNLLLTVISKVKQFGSQVVSKAKEIATNFVNSFINFVKNLPTKLMSILKQIPQKILALGATLRQAGAKIITSLWEGIKSIATSVLDWVKDFADSIKNFFQGILDGFKSVKDKGDEAREIKKSVNGSHANGLDYVPFNGYVAELHKGERVLTAEENKRYNEGKTGTGGDTFNFYNTKPNPYEYARQMKQAKKELLYGF